MNQTFKVNGYIVTYNSSKPTDITKINHLLFGRIATIQKDNTPQKYYYPGLLENVSFKKLTNGCYFITETFPGSHQLLNVLPATVTFSNGEMITGREYWKDRINEKIHNW